MNTALYESLQTMFGFSDFRPGQQPAIENVLAGRDTLVVMPTGSGKSVIYQLAALNLPGLTIVVSPLIALMKDQVDSLAACQAPATFVNSTITRREQEKRLHDAVAGRYRLLYVAPERLRSSLFLSALNECVVSLLAVDEAHCISHWGHDFRPDYLHIAEFRQRVRTPVVAALTATATPRVQADIVQQLAMTTPARVITGFNRPNLTFEVHYAYDIESKYAAMAGLLQDRADGATIVYTGTRRDTEMIAEYVREILEKDVLYYHGGVPADQRTHVQNAFMEGSVSTVVATNAFGMGIDRADVRQVLHFTMPGSLEAYYQEAGRAGRDGRPAVAALIYSPEDRALHEFFIEQGTLTAGERRQLFDALSALQREETRLSDSDIAMHTGFHQIKVRIGLSDLEEAGAIQRPGDVGTQMIIQMGHWDSDRADPIARQALQRQRFKLSQLNHIVRYAESDSCRRRILLDYFGDSGDATSSRCCDNCVSRPLPQDEVKSRLRSELSENDRVALAILDAVRRLEFPLGRDRLAQILRGARTREMHAWGLDTNIYYGRLAGFKQTQIREMIDQLCQQGFLKLVGGTKPVLRLTPRAEEAIRMKASITLQVPEITTRRRASRSGRPEQVGNTVDVTGEMLAAGMGPAEIAAGRGLAVSTIYGHLAVLIGDGKAPLSAVVSEETITHVFDAIQKIGDTSRLAPIRDQLSFEVPWEQIRCVVAGWLRQEHAREASVGGQREPPAACDARQPARRSTSYDVETEKAVQDFLSRTHPRPLAGPWDVGWAVDFHSAHSGSRWERTEVGELTYRLKYTGDHSALERLLAHVERLCAQQPTLTDVDALTPVPSSTGRPDAPVALLASEFAQRLGLMVADVLQMARETAAQKELNTNAQKRANIAGAFRVAGDVRGMRLLVLDDLYDSGATLEEACRVLREAGAARLCVLTLTRTIHSTL